MPQRKNVSITKAHLDASEGRVRSSITYLDREVAHGFRELWNDMDEQFTKINTKLNAIMEAVATRKEMHNLFRELKHQGIHVDESRIFVM